ncbi:MAG: NUDIX hydrolase [Candidatus Aenigmatarchaeota archaeon]
MLYVIPPKDFKPKLRAAGCFCEYDSKILLLLRREDDDIEANKWCIPSGVIENGESPQEAMAREIEEETGIILNPKKLRRFSGFFLRYPDFDFVYHIFHTGFEKKPKVRINKEHREYRWVTPADAIDMELMEDLDSCIKLFYGID